jgi:transcription elongation factor GreA
MVSFSPEIMIYKECIDMATKKMSRESYDKLVAELDDLKINKRKEVAERLKVARSYGDLSENAEYDEAKNEQAILEAQINELQYTIDNAEIVEDDNISVDEIGMSSKITIKRLDNGKVQTFTIVGTNHANVKEGLISDESPIGKAAMKKRVGDIFIVEAPAGELKFEVVEISK